MRLSDASERIAMNPQKRKFGISKKNHSVAESGVLQRMYSTNIESRVFFFDKNQSISFCACCFTIETNFDLRMAIGTSQSCHPPPYPCDCLPQLSHPTSQQTLIQFFNPGCTLFRGLSLMVMTSMIQLNKQSTTMKKVSSIYILQLGVTLLKPVYQFFMSTKAMTCT